MRILKTLSVAILFLTSTVVAQTRIEEKLYKTIDTVKLSMKIYYPIEFKQGQQYPSIILFFGGGWNNGSQDQFAQHAKHFAALGMIGITADYRVKNRHGTTPFESVMDAKSAIRYLRRNAKELGIDPNKLAAGGGSAGGHIAAAADLTQIQEPGEDSAISGRPDALVLFNPVFNNGPGNYGYDRFRETYQQISPFHNIKKAVAPTIVFLGTKDALIPVKTAELYRDSMQAVGSRCDLFLYEGQGHGFFNFKKEITDNRYFNETLARADEFLKSLGLLK